MEEKRGQTKSNTWLVILLVLIIIGLVGYIVYDKVFSKEENENQEKITEKENNKNESQEEITKQENSENEIEKTNTESEKEQIDFTKYIGQWYESEEHSTYRNPNSITIKKTEDNKITFDLYITRTANFDDVEIKIDENNKGTFEAFSDNGPTANDELGKATGYVELSSDSIKLVILQTNIVYLKPDTEYTFTYNSKTLR